MAGSLVVAPVLRTVMTSISPSARTRTLTSPPPRLLAMPCLMAFSTSGCTTSGGTCTRRSASGTSMLISRRSSKRARSISRYAAMRSISSPRRTAVSPERSTARSSDVSFISVVDARAGAVWIR